MKRNIVLIAIAAVLLVGNAVTFALWQGKKNADGNDSDTSGSVRPDQTNPATPASGTGDTNGTSYNIPAADPIASIGKYNYGEALQKAILFYELQRSGKLPETTRTNWRGGSGLSDGADNGLDLTGGWYDAGDNVKFGLPMAYTAALLSWSVYGSKDSYLASGQLPYILDNIKWANDYFIKCHPEPEVFYYQVGDGGVDHSWWGPAEVMQMNRPSYKVDKNSPGSSVTAGTAASLAACAVVFADYDKAYSELCLKHAIELFGFAESTKSDSGYKAANGFYDSWSGWNDELAYAAFWLYNATGDSTYLDKSKSYVELTTKGDYYKWMHCWDDATNGTCLLLAIETGDDKYKALIQKTLDFWTVGTNGERIDYTPKGLAWLTEWGSLRYATTAAFLASAYSNWDGCPSDKKQIYWDFAVSQVNYALGDTGRSFVCGFGENPPVNPHHRTAQGSWSDNMNEPSPGRHTLVGALVGGPGRSDDYRDEVNNYVNNEVACDYNAGFAAALANMYAAYGGETIPDFGAYENVGDEIFVEACVNSSGDNYVEIKAVVYNHTGWPARVTDNIKLRYYVDLSECGADAVTVTANYMQGGKVAGLKQTDDGRYYVEIDLSGYKLYPGGQSQHKCEVQFRMTSSGKWDNTNDPSFDGMGSAGQLKRVDGIEVTEG